jgi:hypothetical protein
VFLSAEGYLTTCSFDYLTDSQDVRIFTICIFVYSYMLPVSLLVLFYSKILGHVREHQKMLAEQVSHRAVCAVCSVPDFRTLRLLFRVCICLCSECGVKPLAILAVQQL